MTCGGKVTVDGGIVIAETASDDATAMVLVVAHRLQCNAGGSILRKAVDTGADGRESDALEPMFDGQCKTRVVAGAQQSLFMIASAMPDRPDSMDHIAGW